MDENVKVDGRTIRKQRCYLDEGLTWELQVVARPSRYPVDGKKPIDIDGGSIRNQAVAALSLLCRHGGIGSKARKGFGSFRDLDGGFDLNACRDKAKEFREVCGLAETAICIPATVETAALDHALDAIEVPLSITDFWTALDRLGFAVQSYAQQYAHKPAKVALGLPRKIHGPRADRAMPGQTNWQRPQSLGGNHRYRPRDTRPDAFRHAAPVHYHLANGADGKLIIRAIAFPSPVLPDLATSKKLLTDLLAHVKTSMGGTTGVPAAGAAPRRPGFLFLRGDRVMTPQGEGVADADVRFGARQVTVDFGDGDFNHFNPESCERLE